MPEQTITMLINGGIAGVFAIFAIVLVDRFVKYLDKRECSWQQIIVDLSLKLAELSQVIQSLKDHEVKHARETSEKLESLSQAAPARKVKRVGRPDS